MGIHMEVAIQHMYALKAKGVRYSMHGSRTGTDGTADCSGAVFASLRKAGAYHPGWVLNTDSMHAWLIKLGFRCIATNQEWTAKRGDIVIFGRKGASGGAAGHVVIFISQTQIIHCTWKSAYANGIYVDNEATTCPYGMGWYVYRLTGSSSSVPTSVKRVRVLPHATHWSPSSRSAKMASFVKGRTFEVKQQRPISYSYSNQEYLISNNGTVLGWILSQDIEGGYGSDKVSRPPQLPAGFTKEEATFINGDAPITTRQQRPSLTAPMATPLYPGQSVRYLGWKAAEGYTWIYTTDQRYIPVRPVGKAAWGTFQ